MFKFLKKKTRPGSKPVLTQLQGLLLKIVVEVEKIGSLVFIWGIFTWTNQHDQNLVNMAEKTHNDEH